MKYPGAIAHGIMFHHFHSERHYQGQGSISGFDFEKILQFIGLDRILEPHEWIKRLNVGLLTDQDVCITLDDGLLCQLEIALPVLEKYNLKAFWFVYSSVFEGELGSKFEIYRVFRSKFFENIDEFYSDFFARIFRSKFADGARKATDGESVKKHSKIFPFYSVNDIKFRFIRDRVLGQREFELIMDAMIRERGLSLIDLSENLWMSDENLAYLNELGHHVGLHSHSHPTALADLSYEDQYEEYTKNRDHLQRVCGNIPLAMAHPVDSYDEHTLEILKVLGIQCGFRSNVFPKNNQGSLNKSKYEIAREDHMNIVRMMAKAEQKKEAGNENKQS